MLLIINSCSLASVVACLKNNQNEQNNIYVGQNDRVTTQPNVINL